MKTFSNFFFRTKTYCPSSRLQVSSHSSNPALFCSHALVTLRRSSSVIVGDRRVMFVALFHGLYCQHDQERRTDGQLIQRLALFCIRYLIFGYCVQFICYLGMRFKALICRVIRFSIRNKRKR